MNTQKNVMTRATALRFALDLPEVQANAEVTTVLTTMLAQITKPRAKAERKPNAEAQERRERVLSALIEAGEPMTCTQTAERAGVSQAQANAALKALTAPECGLVKREVIKRVAMFSAVTE